MKNLFALLIVPAMLMACGSAENTDGSTSDTTEVNVDTTAEAPAVEPGFTLGDASLVAIGTSDLESSMAFYKDLGFYAIQQGVEPYPWAWMTDSTLLIGVFEDGDKYMGFSYYSNDIEPKSQALEAAGFILDAKSDSGLVMEVWLTPDSSAGLAIIQEDPTGLYKPAGKNFGHIMTNGEMDDPAAYPNAISGVFGEYAVACKDLDEAIGWWEQVGFTTLNKVTQGEPYAILTDGMNVLGLHQTTEWSENAITYFQPDATEAIKNMKAAGYTADETPEAWGERHAMFVSPEGQRFFLFSNY